MWPLWQMFSNIPARGDEMKQKENLPPLELWSKIKLFCFKTFSQDGKSCSHQYCHCFFNLCWECLKNTVSMLLIQFSWNSLPSKCFGNLVFWLYSNRKPNVKQLLLLQQNQSISQPPPAEGHKGGWPRPRQQPSEEVPPQDLLQSSSALSPGLLPQSQKCSICFIWRVQNSLVLT